MQPQIMIEPPSCLKICLTCCAQRGSPSCFQYQARSSEQKRLILVSSDQMTLFQSSIVQSMWFLANSRRLWCWLARVSAFSSFSAALKPALRRACWTSYLEESASGYDQLEHLCGRGNAPSGCCGREFAYTAFSSNLSEAIAWWRRERTFFLISSESERMMIEFKRMNKL